MFIRHLPKSAIFSASHLPQLWRNVIVLVFIALCFGTSQKTHTSWRSQCVRSRMYQWNVDIRYMYWWLIKNLRWAVSTGFIAVIAISWTETDTRNMRSKRIKKYAWVVANVNILPRSMKNSKIVRCYQADAAPICFFFSRVNMLSTNINRWFSWFANNAMRNNDNWTRKNGRICNCSQLTELI